MPIIDDSFVIHLPALVKAAPRDGRRIVEVEASNEAVDSEGDVVLQKALLEGASAFLRSGVLDIDHFSEIGDRIGIANPSEWIVGNPMEVKDLGGGRTSVVGELHQPVAGRVTKADELWDGLVRDPPVRWRASIFGWPLGADGFHDARKSRCTEAPGARRYVVKSLDWRSLAFTRHPINTSLEGAAHIVTMKSFMAGLAKTGAFDMGGQAGAPFVPPTGGATLHRPRNRIEMKSHFTHHVEEGKCPFAGKSALLGRSVAAFRDHFMQCCGCDHGEADILALALMQALRHDSH
jgi:hypothetical protein